MLQLKHINKNYDIGDTSVSALKDVSIDFREHEFVSILGPSGCGKTTLLNIAGGLDRYTDGDLIINGISTKEYNDADWDLYRNHSIGFVFQSYNLIPHQSVLANVELALTLSGVSKAERKKRATDALVRVGLGDQLKKKPNQMSGGQMQRVAIARALVNNPDILLADEPTGALDTETSIQIMNILKEISTDKLIIMVTHNPALAEQYSTRIINLLDGRITGDSDVYCADDEVVKPEKKHRTKKSSMSFLTAMSLSMNNLMTKKTRTFLTSFAGSIGIIGIALILSLSNGIQSYINTIQRETLSSYPITIQEESADMSSLITSIMGVNEDKGEAHDNDKVYSSSVMYDLIHTVTNPETTKNNLNLFKTELLDNYQSNELGDYVTNIQYVYDTKLNIYATDSNGKYAGSDISKMYESFYSTSGMNSSVSQMMSSGFSDMNVWSELLPGSISKDGKYSSYVSPLVTDQYDLVYGEWPKSYDEVILVLSKNNEISDITLYSMGLMTTEEMQALMIKAMTDADYESAVQSWSYEDICNISFKLLLSTDFFRYNNETGKYEDVRDNKTALDLVIDANGVSLKICGIVKPSVDSTASMISGSLAYTSALTDYIITQTANSEIVKKQMLPENSNLDVITGLPFKLENEVSDSDKISIIKKDLAVLSDKEKSNIYIDFTTTPSDEYVNAMLDNIMSKMPDRDSMINMIIEQYSSKQGVSGELLSEILSGYTDEKLNEMVTGAVREMIISNYVAVQTKKINDAAELPSQSELIPIKETISSAILQSTDKVSYIASVYAEETVLPIESIYQYVAGLSSDEIDRIFDSMVEQKAIDNYVNNYPSSDTRTDMHIAAMLDSYVSTADDATLIKLYDLYATSSVSGSTYEDNLKLLGVVNPDSPKAVNIYASTFEAKDKIANIIKDYNENHEEKDRIEYTDYIALIMSSITTIINVISYVLIAFVAISLVVSSIMIGIITYISVLERTKEIGILRSIGASKKDISRVFNAETMIVGFTAGLIGIIITVLLCFPISWIVQSLSGISDIRAWLPWLGGVILMIISIGLTLIAGLIPSRIAAKKDPVVALRTE